MKHRMNPRLTFVVALLMLGLAACSAGSGTGGGDPLNGTSWTLASIDGAAAIPDVNSSVQFKDGEVGGSGGCNSYGGAYEVNGDKIEIKDLVSTLMACTDPEGAMEQESTFLGGLGTAESFKLTADRLEILTSDGKTLTFVPAQ